MTGLPLSLSRVRVLPFCNDALTSHVVRLFRVKSCVLPTRLESGQFNRTLVIPTTVITYGRASGAGSLGTDLAIESGQ